ncbi:MAG: hypothetical protein U5L04_04920 [Trueperaceae bacterium]|nr:hypothetical protein [Trueperaceae bacterium]
MSNGPERLEQLQMGLVHYQEIGDEQGQHDIYTELAALARGSSEASQRAARLLESSRAFSRDG